MNWIYEAVVALATWLVLVPWHMGQIFLGRVRWADLHERLGSATIGRRGGGRRVVIHAVSAGEMAAAGPVVVEMAAMEPALSVVLTTCCEDGRAVAERIRKACGAVEGVMWLPWDRSGAVRRWLSRLGPAMVVVVETEIWPGLFFACRRLGIPLCLINGRIYAKDVWRYRLGFPFFKRVLACASWIGAQTSVEQERFISIGAAASSVEVVGNPKYAFVPRGGTGDGRIGILRDLAVLIAGSTHEPEEQWILDAYRRIRNDFLGLRLIIAPRKVERSGDLMGLVSRLGIRPVAWTRWDGSSLEWDVLILDELGWLAEVYGSAKVAVIGGTFIDHGGQNPIEAAVHSIPVVMGPSSQNFDEITRDLEMAGAVLRLPSADGLADALRKLLAEPGLAARMGAAGRDRVLGRRAVARQYAAELLKRCRPADQ